MTDQTKGTNARARRDGSRGDGGEPLGAEVPPAVPAAPSPAPVAPEPPRRTRRAPRPKPSPAAPAAERREPRRLPISVVVPARDAATWIVDCLTPIHAERPAQVILVDGGSTDGTVALARPFVDEILADSGEGPSAARMLGLAAATHPWVLLLDSDVVMPAGGAARLLDEAEARGLDGLQAQQLSEGAGDAWSEALADHHRRGRSRHWFGTNATLLRREVLEAHPLDPSLRSGEDIDLRIRLRDAGVPVGISESVQVSHRYAPGRIAAGHQWDDDGRGLGRMIRKHGFTAFRSALIPLAVGAAGLLAAPFRRGADGFAYYLGYLLGNYRGLWAGLLDRRVAVPATEQAIAMATLGVTLVAVAAAGLLAVVGVPALLLVSAIGDNPFLVALVGLASVVSMAWLEFALSFPEGDPRHERAQSLRLRILLFGSVGVVLAGVRLLAIIRPFD